MDFHKEPVEFDEEETASFLEGKPAGELADATLEKMKCLNMTGFSGTLARNLKALFGKETA